MIITRLAPTPSGYLHAGNAINFLVTARLVKQLGGQLRLRIDDLDAARFRIEYVDDIFWALDWLGIDVDSGPSGTTDFLANHSLRDRTEHYRAELGRLAESGLTTYACTCSRRTIAQSSPDGRYRGTCRVSDHSLRTDRSALRIQVPDRTVVEVSSRRVDLHEEMGDFILWRRDDLPAYQLASVIEDRDAGVNLIVRGEDLLTSSAAQIFLAPGLRAEEFAAARFIHHPLLTGPGGAKLSKSQRASPLREVARSPGALERIHRLARDLMPEERLLGDG